MRWTTYGMRKVSQFSGQLLLMKRQGIFISVNYFEKGNPWLKGRGRKVTGLRDGGPMTAGLPKEYKAVPETYFVRYVSGIFVYFQFCFSPRFVWRQPVLVPIPVRRSSSIPQRITHSRKLQR